MAQAPKTGSQYRQYRPGEYIAGEYKVLAVFGGEGKSGQGVVYLVDHRDAPAPFVLKTYQLHGPDARSLFFKEATSWVSLGFHQNLVSAYWVRELDGQVFIAAEYVPQDSEGRATITDFIADGPQPLNTVCVWAIQFCDGLAQAFAKGLIAHHDVKPDNLMVDPAGVLRITDFGLATTAGDDRGAGGGTLLYMAPEKVLGGQPVDHRADIYAFGIVLYQLLTGGRYPYRLAASPSDPVMEIARVHVREPVVRISSPLYPIIERCLDKNPERRFSCIELRDEVVKIAQRAGVRIPDPSPAQDNSADELYARAQSFVALGKPAEALQAATSYLERWPANACGWIEKGRILLEMGRPQEAVDATKESLRCDPSNSHAWNNLGACYRRLERNEEAGRAFRRAIDCDPYNTGAMMQLAVILAEAGQTGEPTELLLRALKLRPQKETLRFNAGNAAALIVKTGGMEEGRILLERLLSLDLDNPATWFNLALVHHSVGRLNEATECYRRTVALNPDDGFAWMSLARLLAERGSFDEAMKCCDSCPTSSPEKAKTIPFKAQLLAATGNYPEAVTLLTRSLQASPNDDALWFILATIYERQGSFSDALQAARRCRALLEKRGDVQSENFEMVSQFLARIRAR